MVESNNSSYIIVPLKQNQFDSEYCHGKFKFRLRNTTFEQKLNKILLKFKFK